MSSGRKSVVAALFGDVLGLALARIRGRPGRGLAVPPDDELKSIHSVVDYKQNEILLLYGIHRPLTRKAAADHPFDMDEKSTSGASSFRC